MLTNRSRPMDLVLRITSQTICCRRNYYRSRVDHSRSVLCGATSAQLSARRHPACSAGDDLVARKLWRRGLFGWQDAPIVSTLWSRVLMTSRLDSETYHISNSRPISEDRMNLQPLKTASWSAPAKRSPPLPAVWSYPTPHRKSPNRVKSSPSAQAVAQSKR